MEHADRVAAIAEMRNAPARRELVTIDGLRAVAAVWVLLHHANLMFWQSRDREHDADALVRLCYQTLGLGWLGVPLFFVISGFCIHLPYARAARVNPREYVVRRAVRIWPPFAAAIVAGLIFQLAKGHHAPSLFAHFAANLAFLFPGRGPIGDDNIVFWSIVVEVQLYAIYLAIRLLGGRLRTWTIAFLAVGVAYHVAWEFVAVPESIARLIRPRFFAPARMGEWLLGAIVAERMVNRPPVVRPRGDGGLIVGGVALIAASRVATTSLGFEQHAFETFASAGFAMILASLVRWERRRDRPLTAPWLVEIGRRCYSLYLFHFFAINVALYVAARHVFAAGNVPSPGSGRWLATIGAGVALAIVLAEIAYRFVERPSHRLARRWGGRAAGGST